MGGGKGGCWSGGLQGFFFFLPQQFMYAVNNDLQAEWVKKVEADSSCLCSLTGGMCVGLNSLDIFLFFEGRR